jgi:hypothetical protein
MTTSIQRLLTKSEAQRLVTEINCGAADVRAKLLLLHDGEGWRALGYKTWKECVEGEFVFGRQYAYRQLAAAQIEQRLSPIGDTGNHGSQLILPESHARELACVPVDRQLEVYQRALQTSPNGLTAKHIAKTIAQMGIRKTKNIFDDVDGPTMRRHQSSGSHSTPPELLSAIEGRFDLIGIDLAADSRNAVTVEYISRKENSLKQNWTKLLKGRLGYLNSPFDPMDPWADKSIYESSQGARLGVLGQASVGSNWFWKMFPLCATYVLTPRPIFLGHKSSFPKDVIFCAFNLVGSGVRKSEVGRITRWQWQRENDQRLVRGF